MKKRICIEFEFPEGMSEAAADALCDAVGEKLGEEWVKPKVEEHLEDQGLHIDLDFRVDLQTWKPAREKSEDGLAIQTTGDPAEDAAHLEKARIHNARMQDNVCPNGCALMVPDKEDPEHVRHCPVCQFTGFQNTPIEYP